MLGGNRCQKSPHRTFFDKLTEADTAAIDAPLKLRYFVYRAEAAVTAPALYNSRSVLHSILRLHKISDRPNSAAIHVPIKMIK